MPKNTETTGDRVIEALDRVDPIERFLRIVRDIEGATSP